LARRRRFFNLQLPSTRLLLHLRYDNLQHSVTEYRCSVVSVDAFWKRDFAVEASTDQLADVIVSALFLVLFSTLSLNHDRVVADLDLHVSSVDPR
jgi:hypothetical protein